MWDVRPILISGGSGGGYGDECADTDGMAIARDPLLTALEAFRRGDATLADLMAAATPCESCGRGLVAGECRSCNAARAAGEKFAATFGMPFDAPPFRAAIDSAAPGDPAWSVLAAMLGVSEAPAPAPATAAAIPTRALHPLPRQGGLFCLPL